MVLCLMLTTESLANVEFTFSPFLWIIPSPIFCEQEHTHSHEEDT